MGILPLSYRTFVIRCLTVHCWFCRHLGLPSSQMYKTSSSTLRDCLSFWIKRSTTTERRSATRYADTLMIQNILLDMKYIVHSSKNHNYIKMELTLKRSLHSFRKSHSKVTFIFTNKRIDVIVIFAARILSTSLLLVYS